MKGSRRKIITACSLALILVIFSGYVRYRDYSRNPVGGLLSVSDVSTQPQMDTLDSTSDVSASSTDLTGPAVNQTDMLGQKLFAGYMVLQQSGNLNDQTAQEFVDNLASQVDASITPAYQMSDLTIIPDPTIGQLKDYANSFWAIREKYANQYQKNPLGSANFAADPSDPTFESGFSTVGSLYIEMAEDLAKLPVPVALATLHLDLLNNYAASGQALKQIGGLNSDSIATITGLNTFGQYSDYETTTLEIMAKYFSDSGIIFTSNDPGIGWNTI